MFRTTKQEVYSHQVFLDEEIGAPSKYRDLINTLYMSGENDQVNLLINSSGGYLSTAIAIIEGIKASDAMVRAIIVGECHSAASMIALNCHEIVVTDSAHMMTHTASYGTGGMTQNVKSHSDFSTGFINKIIDSTYSGFMQNDEIIELKKGVEFWFDADQIRTRLESRLEYLKKKTEVEKKLQVKKSRQKKT
jgi:ATP-dependent protease ClpP protease subunit